MAVYKPRKPGSRADAITKIMGALTAEGAGDVVGKSERTVRAWSDPDEAMWPDWGESAALDAGYVREGHGEAPLLKHYESKVAQLAGEVPPHQVGNPLERITEAHERFSTALRLYGDVAAIDLIDQVTAARIVYAMDDLIRAAQLMAADVAARIEPASGAQAKRPKVVGGREG